MLQNKSIKQNWLTQCDEFGGGTICCVTNGRQMECLKKTFWGEEKYTIPKVSGTKSHISPQRIFRNVKVEEKQVQICSYKSLPWNSCIGIILKRINQALNWHCTDIIHASASLQPTFSFWGLPTQHHLQANNSEPASRFTIVSLQVLKCAQSCRRAPLTPFAELHSHACPVLKSLLGQKKGLLSMSESDKFIGAGAVIDVCMRVRKRPSPSGIKKGTLLAFRAECVKASR